MLQLDFASALVDTGAAAGRQTVRVPKVDWGLHPCLVLTRAEGRVRVQNPIATSRTREADLKEHAVDGLIAGLPLAISEFNFFLLSSG